MRKLVYVGTDGIEVIETTSYETMKEIKKEGFTFTEKMVEVKEEEKKVDDKIKTIIEKRKAILKNRV